MDFTVREMGASDRLAWAEMRASLWPEDSVSAHAAEIDGLIRAEVAWGFIAETADGAPVGFSEVAIRKYANGCETRPVPFLEGIWVRAEFRRQGVGTRLIRHVEAFLSERGFRELGSDARIENSLSHASHLGWGFSETERVVYFRKPLNPHVR
jgi:aminoglycoside 6'-N-acetyltransferase I